MSAEKSRGISGTVVVLLNITCVLSGVFIAAHYGLKIFFLCFGYSFLHYLTDSINKRDL